MDSFGGSEQPAVGGNSIAASLSQELSSISVTGDKQDSKPRSDVKLSHLASGTELNGGVQATETRLADLLDTTLWNRKLAPSSERIVYALVQQIFHGIREYFLASAELKVCIISDIIVTSRTLTLGFNEFYGRMTIFFNSGRVSMLLAFFFLFSFCRIDYFGKMYLFQVNIFILTPHRSPQWLPFRSSTVFSSCLLLTSYLHFFMRT